MFELLLDDLLSALESRGIDTSKLKLVEELDSDIDLHHTFLYGRRIP